MKDSLQGGEGGGNTVCRVGRGRKYSLQGGEEQDMKKTEDEAVQEKSIEHSREMVNQPINLRTIILTF